MDESFSCKSPACSLNGSESSCWVVFMELNGKLKISLFPLYSFFFFCVYPLHRLSGSSFSSCFSNANSFGIISLEGITPCHKHTHRTYFTQFYLLRRRWNGSQFKAEQSKRTAMNVSLFKLSFSDSSCQFFNLLIFTNICVCRLNDFATGRMNGESEVRSARCV